MLLHNHRPAPTVYNACRAFVAGVCVLAMFSSAIHHLLTSHSVCAEHGEAIEATAPERVTPPPPSAQVLAHAAQLAEDGHGHCPAAFQRRVLWTVARPVALQTPRLVPDAALGVLAVEPICAGLDVLAVAPKSSPPLSA